MNVDTPYWIWLQSAVGQGSALVPQLLNAFSTPREIFAADRETLKRAGAYGKMLENLCRKILDEAVAIAAHSERIGWLLTPDDERYPQSLRQLYSQPLVLYGQGSFPDFNALTVPPIGVVGTRQSTSYGEKAAGSIAAGLAAAGSVIVSGGAKGIDCAAHQGTLYAGGTAVLVKACGLEVQYPRTTLFLQRQVLANGGAVITEYPPDVPVYPYHFEVRNRLISGLAWGVCIVEAPRNSGALITARLAREQGRDVFVVPGNITSKESFGSNALIQDGAALVTRAGEILQEYQYRCHGELLEQEANDMQEAYGEYLAHGFSQEPVAFARRVADATVPSFDAPAVACPFAATDAAKAVYAALTDKPITAELLCAQTNLPAGKVFSALTELELYGCAKSYPGKRYSR